MLTSLNWLSPGNKYPPKCEEARINNYIINEQLFETKHAEAFGTIFEEIARSIHKKPCDIYTIINYHQLLSKKTADFVCGEPPTIETELDTDKITQLLEQQRWASKLYEAIIDVSRYGNGLLKIVGKNISAVSPRYWFPIVASSDLKCITQHVIAYPINPDNDGKYTQLYVEIHSIGKLETRYYEYKDDKSEIGNLIKKINSKTNLQDFAIQQLTNVTHSGDVYGIDDYQAINSLLASIIWRLSRINLVLDKHSEPTVSGPSSMLSYDERFHTYFTDFGRFFAHDDVNQPDIKYVTWDGNLESAYKEIDTLLEQLYTISEMGQAFALNQDGGTATSGKALRLRLVSPLAKASRIVNNNVAAIKKLIIMLAGINGIALDYSKLTLHWNDGLPIDESEQLDNLTNATGGKAIMSQYAALKRMGLSDIEAEAELEQMAKEDAASSPLQLTTFDPNAGAE